MIEQAAQDATSTPDQAAGDQLLRRAGRAGGGWVAVLATTAIITAVGETALPALLGGTLDAVLRNRSAGPWLWWTAAAIVLLVGCDTLDDLAAGAVTARSTAWLRRAVLGHVLATGAPAARGRTPGDLTSRLVGNSADAGRVAPAVIRGATALIPAVGGTVALAVIDPWLCATFLVGLPVMIYLVRGFARDITELSARYLRLQGDIAGRFGDALSGARTIAAAGTAEREAERVLKPLPELHRHGMGMWRAQTRISTQDALVVPLLEIAVVAVAGVLLAAGRITPGELVAAGQYVFLAAGLTSAVSFVNRLGRARAGAGRAAEVLADPAIAYGDATLPPGSGRLDLRGVTVREHGRTVLDGIDLTLAAGSLVAVVGHSGVGKSLLAALAGRLADPDEGEILLDGVPLGALGRAELRRAVGYGFERPVLMGETVAGAIAFGTDGGEPVDVRAAARAAQADAFIRRLPDGYATRLAEAPMSGGETQRVGLARAFARATRLLVLDDVAASLDTVTEHRIAEVLTGALAGTTRLVVAHRASTAARADTVVWLDRGGVRATGPHGVLWRDPTYRALFEPSPDPSGGQDL